MILRRRPASGWEFTRSQESDSGPYPQSEHYVRFGFNKFTEIEAHRRMDSDGGAWKRHQCFAVDVSWEDTVEIIEAFAKAGHPEAERLVRASSSASFESDEKGGEAR
jgi:hypothetical protein